MKPLVSVVIPIYNRESFLSRVYSSVKAQTYRPLQLILVDNNSTDASLSLCKSFKENNLENTFSIEIYEETTCGASAARNKGLFNAKGDFVYFFDSDDEMSPSFISDVVAVCQREKCNMVAVRTTMIMPSGKEKVRKTTYSCSVADQILLGMLSTQSMFFSTAFLRSINGWDEKLLRWNDLELGVRLLLSYPRISWIKKTAYHRIYQHNESITGSSFSASITDLINALEQIKTDIDTSSHSGKSKFMRALFYRTLILAGQVRKEGDRQKALNLLGLSSKCQIGFFARLAGKLLYRYVFLGGKGAWLIARHL